MTAPAPYHDETPPPSESQPQGERPRGPGLASVLGRLPAPLRVAVLLLALAVIAFGIILVRRDNAPADDPAAALYGPNDARPPEKGQPAPDFTLASLDGTSVRLSSLRGTPVVLNFWATWCGPCREEMPTLQASYAAANGSFVLLGINSEGTAAGTAKRLATDFKDEIGVTFPVLLDSPDQDVFNQYRLLGMPDTFFIDKDGVIRDVVIGPLTRQALEEKLNALLAP